MREDLEKLSVYVADWLLTDNRIYYCRNISSLPTPDEHTDWIPFHQRVLYKGYRDKPELKHNEGFFCTNDGIGARRVSSINIRVIKQDLGIYLQSLMYGSYKEEVLH